MGKQESGALASPFPRLTFFSVVRDLHVGIFLDEELTFSLMYMYIYSPEPATMNFVDYAICLVPVITLPLLP